MYSGTLPYGHPWNVAIHDNVDTLLSPKFVYIHLRARKADPPYSIMRTVVLPHEYIYNSDKPLNAASAWGKIWTI